jgi:hypothetical protein
MPLPLRWPPWQKSEERSTATCLRHFLGFGRGGPPEYGDLIFQREKEVVMLTEALLEEASKVVVAKAA